MLYHCQQHLRFGQIRSIRFSGSAASKKKARSSLPIERRTLTQKVFNLFSVPQILYKSSGTDKQLLWRHNLTLLLASIANMRCCLNKSTLFQLSYPDDVLQQWWLRFDWTPFSKANRIPLALTLTSDLSLLQSGCGSTLLLGLFLHSFTFGALH